MLPPIRASGQLPEEHRALLDHLVSQMSRAAVVFFDVNGFLTTWNPGVEKLLGYKQPEWVGQPGAIIFTEEDRENNIPEFERQTAAKNGDVADIRWHRRKDGSRIFIDGLMQALYSEDGNLLGFAKLMKDSTDRQLVKEKLERLTGALNQAQVLMRSLDGNIEFWSEGSHRLYGFPQHEAIGKNVHKLLTTSCSSTFEEIDAELQSTGVWHGEILRTRRDGTPIVCATDWILHRAATDDRVTVIEASTDITNQKRVEEHLQFANQELRRFSEIVSHDLQAPLRMVRSYAELLSRRHKASLDPAAGEFLDVIVNGAKNMDLLIRTLLQYAQTAARSVVKQPVDTASTVQTVLSTLRPDIEEAHANIESRNLPTVEADPVQFVQLFQNLLGNALKYRSSGCAPFIEISAHSSDAEWIFDIKDNGIGIDPEHRERIFDPLRRLHGAEIAGTGIGLAVCKQIVERHGGRIWVESPSGSGSVFRFTLPKTT